MVAFKNQCEGGRHLQEAAGDLKKGNKKHATAHFPPQSFNASSPISPKRSCIGYQPTHNSSTMEALSNPSKVETMRMVNSLEEYESDDPTAEVTYNVLPWIYRFYIKSTHYDRPRIVYRMALEALVEVIERDNTNEQRKAILFVKKILIFMMKENPEMLQIIFEEHDNETNDSRIIFTIHSRFHLKVYCKLYAKKRGISIKYLRFSYKGKLMFLSDMTDGTPETLGIRDNDVIMVHHQSDSNKENMTDTSNQKHMVTTDKKKKVAWKKCHGKAQIKLDKHTMTVEDYKRQHSMILSKLHEEMQPRLREIRLKLNILNIERQPPKSKSKVGRKCAKEDPIDHDALPRSGVGCKAGRSNFVVQVGEVQNLYKTTKSSALASSHLSQSSVPTLDLHGCTREEAIARLNESLEEWVDIAMKGYDPFVITAMIVCGCGSQVLYETVQEWIKSTSQVRNAPKNHLN